MMPLFGAYEQRAVIGANYGATLGTTINSTGWVELEASTVEDYDAFVLYLNFRSTNEDVHVSVAIGDAGSEQVIVDRALYPGRSHHFRMCCSYWLPISIPAGSRIAVKAVDDTNNAASHNMYMVMHRASGNAAPAFSVFEEIGEATIDPGGTENVLSGWAEIASSVAHDYPLITWRLFPVDKTIGNNINMLYDMAVGAAGNEKLLMQQLYAHMGNGIDTYAPIHIPLFPFGVKAGDRLSWRCQLNSSNAVERNSIMKVWGVR